MTKLASHNTNWEVGVMLPLDVVGSQLRRIEEQLRILDMRALDLGNEGETPAVRGQIDARLERIRESLGAIAGLIDDIDTDVQAGKKRRPCVDD